MGLSSWQYGLGTPSVTIAIRQGSLYYRSTEDERRCISLLVSHPIQRVSRIELWLDHPGTQRRVLRLYRRKELATSETTVSVGNR